MDSDQQPASIGAGVAATKSNGRVRFEPRKWRRLDLFRAPRSPPVLFAGAPIILASGELRDQVIAAKRRRF
jgi:hypothetical protein